MSKPEWQFRDQKVPARVFFLLQQGKLTVTDLIIMAVVDAMVTPQTHEAGLGCWATNAYLGQVADVHETYASQRISYLEGLGVLLVIRLGGKRYLELEWSRTAEERAAMEGDYGEACRKAHHTLLKKLADDRAELYENLKTPLAKPKAAALAKPKTEYNGEYEGGYGGPAARRSPPPSKLSEQAALAANQPHLAAAKKLRKAVRDGAKLPFLSSNQSTANELRLLAEVDGQDYDKVLDWYCRSCTSTTALDQARLPRISSGQQFRKRYDWILERYDKAQLPESRRNGKPAADGTSENPNPKRYRWHPEYGIVGEYPREEWDTSVVRKKVKGGPCEGE